MSARDLLAAAASLREEKRRIFDGTDTWSTRKAEQVVLELSDVEAQIRELAVTEYEALLDIAEIAAGFLIDRRFKAALARLDEIRSGT